MAFVPAATAAMTWGQALPLMVQMAAPSVAGLGVGVYAARKFRQFIRAGGRSRRRVSYRALGKRIYTRRRYSRKRSYRSAKKRGRRKYKRRRYKKSAKSQCWTIAKQLNSDTGNMTYRKRTVTSSICAINVQSVNVAGINTVAQIEGSPCTKLYYYDPSTPGTLLNPDYTTGIYSRDLNVKSSGIQLQFKNNTTGLVNLSIYWCISNSDTSIAPEDYWDNVCADNPTTITKEVIGVKPNDLRTPLWNYAKVKTCRLMLGKFCFVKKYLKGF